MQLAENALNRHTVASKWNSKTIATDASGNQPGDVGKIFPSEIAACPIQASSSPGAPFMRPHRMSGTIAQKRDPLPGTAGFSPASKTRRESGAPLCAERMDRSEVRRTKRLICCDASRSESAVLARPPIMHNEATSLHRNSSFLCPAISAAMAVVSLNTCRLPVSLRHKEAIA
jgi:hypothetical protein